MLRPVRPLLVPLSLVLLGGGFLSLLAAGRQGQAPVDAGIRFVDVHKAMINSKFFEKRLEKIKDFLKQRRAQIDNLNKEFKQKRKELGEMDRGSKEAELLGLELAQRKAQLEFLNQMTKNQAKRNEKELEKAVYDMVRRTIGAYAVTEKLQAVFVIDEARAKKLKEEGRPGILSLEMEANTLRNVLWHNTELDITDEIIKLLNK